MAASTPCRKASKWSATSWAFSHISAQEAQTVFTQFVQPHSYASFVPVPNVNALVVTENSHVLRKLVQLKELIDVPPARVTTEFVSLERAGRRASG